MLILHNIQLIVCVLPNVLQQKQKQQHQAKHTPKQQHQIISGMYCLCHMWCDDVVICALCFALCDMHIFPISRNSMLGWIVKLKNAWIQHNKQHTPHNKTSTQNDTTQTQKEHIRQLIQSDVWFHSFVHCFLCVICVRPLNSFALSPTNKSWINRHAQDRRNNV